MSSFVSGVTGDPILGTPAPDPFLRGFGLPSPKDVPRVPPTVRSRTPLPNKPIVLLVVYVRSVKDESRGDTTGVDGRR